MLTVSSYPTRTSVVIRGKYILNNILGSPPPPPPADVPPLDEAAVGASASLRQQMEKHRADAMCASCHNKMDPLGFGLENYDGIGKWRDHGREIPGGFLAARCPTEQASPRPGKCARSSRANCPSSPVAWWRRC